MEEKYWSWEEKDNELWKHLLPLSEWEESTKLINSKTSQEVNTDPYIGTYHEADDYIKDNEYIETGYRINYTTVWRTIKSLFVAHNETVNIWSHLIGVIAFFATTFYIIIFLTKGHVNVKSKFEEHLCDDLLSQFGVFTNIPLELKSKETLNYYVDILNDMETDIDTKTSLGYNLDANIATAWKDEIQTLLVSLDDMKQTILSIDKSSANDVKYSIIYLKYQAEKMKDIYASKYGINGITDGVSKIPLLLHIFWAMIWLFFSSLFHLFCWHSKEACSVLSRFDYGGIAILIAGSATPIYIYTFYWSKNAFFGYIYTGLLNAVCLTAFVITLLPRFDAPKYRKWRALLFVIVGLSAAGPVFHIIFFRDKELSPAPPYLLLGLGGILYILGAVIYSTRFPERFKKHTFDYIGNSHNIWHCFVLSAAATQFAASVLTYLNRLDSPCPV